MGLTVHGIRTNEWGEIGYVIHKIAGQALIIDPGGKAEEFISYLEGNDLTPGAILNTHGHHDHVGAVTTLREHFGISFYLHGRDESLLKSANFYIRLFGSKESIKIPPIDIDIESVGTELDLAGMQIQIISTPGHTPGGVCYKIDAHMMTGDTLFAGEIGRTDLPGGDKAALASSLKRVSEFPPETIIHPGHGRSSTIGEENDSNIKMAEMIN